MLAGSENPDPGRQTLSAELFTRENIDTLVWPATPDGDYARRCLLPLIVDGPQKYIRNVHNTQVMVVRLGETLLPLTITDFHPDNTYTCSPYSHYISYGGYEEIRHLHNPMLEALIKSALRPLAWYFRTSAFDRVVYVNNWLLSTNLYPVLSAAQLQALAERLPGWFPDRAIVFRSLDRFRNAHVLDTLVQLGYASVLSRQVWYQDPQQAQHRKQFKVDRSAQRRSAYESVDGRDCTDVELARMLELYGRLYLDKYSYYNPQFSLEFLKMARDQEWLTLRGLRNQNGRIDGVMGFFTRSGLMTQPLFGYDTSQPAAAKLYQILSLMTLQEGLARGLIVHASAGVGKFKKLRGGEPFIEYSAVYTRHLPTARRLPWKIIQAISCLLIPVFQKNEF